MIHRYLLIALMSVLSTVSNAQNTEKHSDNKTATTHESTAASINAISSTKANCPLPDGFKEASTDSPTDSRLTINDIQLDTTSGKDWTLLNLWALWCAPCREELPLLDKVKQTSFQILTINLGDDAKDVTELFATENIQTLPQYITHDDTLLNTLGAVGLPMTAILYKNTVIAKKAGRIKETESIVDYFQCQKVVEKQAAKKQ